MNAETSNHCILCKKTNADVFLRSFETHGKKIINKKKMFDLYKCRYCSSIFLGNITINKDYYDKFYDQNYYTDEGGVLFKIWSNIYKYFLGKKEKIILKRFNKCKKINLLDIGCGNGDFLRSLKSEIIIKKGLEINPQGIELCKKSGFKIYDKDITSADFSGEKFDVITMWHVLEHLPNPQEVFFKIRNILSDEGVLIFQIPNADSLGFRFGKRYWFHLDSPRHLVLYNEKSIKKLCRLTGFNLVEIKNEFYDYPLDLFWSIRKSSIRYLIYPLYPLFKLFSKEHITFICKKNEN